jgi:preprotein translocase subunit SecG
MFQALIVVHMVAAIAMVACILLQQGKGATAGAGGLGGSGGGSGSVFGSQGSANFLSRTTAILATVFFATSLFLSVMGGRSAQSEQDLMDDVDLPVIEQGVPATSQSDVPLSAIPSSIEELETVPAGLVEPVLEADVPVVEE